MKVWNLNQNSTSSDGCVDLNQTVVDSLVVMAVWT